MASLDPSQSFRHCEDTNLSTLCDSTGNTSNRRDELPLQDVQYIYITVTCFYVIVFLFGVLGNVLVICVVCVQRDMRTPTNLFLVNLSVADLLVLLFCMPTSLIEFHAREVWHMGQAMCKLTFFLEHAVAHTSILTILAISFERYYAICCPFKVLYTCTTQRAIKINGALWTCGLLSAVPFLFLAFTASTQHATAGEVEICRLPITNAWSITYVIAIQQVFFTIPLAILIGLYVRISKALPNKSFVHIVQPGKNPHALSKDENSTSIKMLAFENDRKRLDSSQQRRRQFSTRRRQIVYMVMAIMILFFVCLMPLRVVTMWLIFSPIEDKERLGLEGFLNLTAFARIMFYLNSAGNPILYNLVSTKFRLACRRTMHCRVSPKHSFVSMHPRTSHVKLTDYKQRSASTYMMASTRADNENTDYQDAFDRL